MSRKFRFRGQLALPETKLSDNAMHCRFPILEALKVIFEIEYALQLRLFHDILLGYLSGDKFSLNIPTNIWYSYMGHVNSHRNVRARSSRLRAVSYFSLQIYCTQAAKPHAARTREEKFLVWSHSL